MSDLELRLKQTLGERADRVASSSLDPESVVRRARPRRTATLLAAFVAGTSVLLAGAAVAGRFLPNEDVPVIAPIEQGQPQSPTDELPPMETVHTAEDGYWTLQAGVSADGETICFSLSGAGCAVISDAPFVPLTVWDDLSRVGFVYGPVGPDVSRMQLVSGLSDRPVVVRDFPEGFDASGLRFFVEPLTGEDVSGELVAWDSGGRELERIGLPFEDEPDPTQPHSLGPIVFPVQDPTKVVMEALFEGDLIRSGRCLYLVSGPRDWRTRDERVLPIWPHGFTHEVVGEHIVVLDERGREVARSGAPIVMGGGMVGESDASSLSEELAERVRGCGDGPYWIVGEI